MTDERMRLLKQAEAMAATGAAAVHIVELIRSYLSSNPEPQGEMPEPDVIQQAREAGDMAGTAVIKMLRAYDALASRLREADGQVAFWKERSMSADAEMNLYKGRAEAAERGREGMVQVPKTLTNQMREVLEDPDLESRMPQQIWDYLLSAAEEGK